MGEVSRLKNKKVTKNSVKIKWLNVRKWILKIFSEDFLECHQDNQGCTSLQDFKCLQNKNQKMILKIHYLLKNEIIQTIQDSEDLFGFLQVPWKWRVSSASNLAKC